MHPGQDFEPNLNFQCLRLCLHWQLMFPLRGPAVLWLTVCALAMNTASAVTLWSDLGATLVRDSGPGTDILGGAVRRDNTATDTLYFKFHIDPLSDVSTEEYFAAFELYEG